MAASSKSWLSSQVWSISRAFGPPNHALKTGERANPLNGTWVLTTISNRNHSHVIASTHSGSLLYRFDDQGAKTSLTQISHAGGFVTNERTLAFANVAKRSMIGGKAQYGDSNYAVQVVPSGIYLLEYDRVHDAYNEVAKYRPADVGLKVQTKPTEITAASINASQIAVAFDRGIIQVLAISEKMTEFIPSA